MTFKVYVMVLNTLLSYLGVEGFIVDDTVHLGRSRRIVLILCNLHGYSNVKRVDRINCTTRYSQKGTLLMYLRKGR